MWPLLLAVGLPVVTNVVVDDLATQILLQLPMQYHSHYSISKHGDLSVQISNYASRKPVSGLTHRPPRYMLNDNDIFDRTGTFQLLEKARRIYGRAKNIDKRRPRMGQLIPSRDRRRIIGEYTLTTEHILTNRTPGHHQPP